MRVSGLRDRTGLGYRGVFTAFSDGVLAWLWVGRTYQGFWEWARLCWYTFLATYICHDI